jgi:hypothetical protein
VILPSALFSWAGLLHVFPGAAAAHNADPFPNLPPIGPDVAKTRAETGKSAQAQKSHTGMAKPPQAE